jgi:hypothetical protein
MCLLQYGVQAASPLKDSGNDLMRNHDALYWFTYYGNHVRLRVRCTKCEHDSIQATVDAAMQALGLQYRKNAAGVREEVIYRLEEDLGGTRFLSQERLDLSPLERGLLVLNLLHAGGGLFINSLIKDGDYWREEINTDGNNGLKSASRSYLHLLHNQAMSDIPVVLCQDKNGGIRPGGALTRCAINVIPRPASFRQRPQARGGCLDVNFAH